MASRWRKVRDILTGNLNFNLCASGYTPIDDAPSQTSTMPPPPPPPPATAKDSSFDGIVSSSGSSKRTCAICLGSMKPGHSRALFTAECAHTFHFHCIASSFGHGNRTCPVCRATWKEIPILARPPPHPHPRRRPNRPSPVNQAHENVNLVAPRSRPSSRYDDDEPLDVQAQPREVREHGRSKTLECTAYPEFSQVHRSAIEGDFTVLINLKASTTSSVRIPTADAEAIRAPIDLVTVLDISGSMAGSKLALLKRAMEFLIHNLGPSDRLSVVSFSSTARRLFPLLKMSESGRERAIQAIDALVASGGTNIAEGLKKGTNVIGGRRAKNPICSIMLLSDGQDTCRRTAASVHPERNVPIHTFGFGADHDPDRMHSISEHSGGTFSFIESADTIQEAFAQCIGGLLSVELQDVHVAFECVDPRVHVQSITTGSYPNCISNQKRAGTIDVGDLYAGEERNFLVSLNVPPTSESITNLLKIRCQYKDPMSGRNNVHEDVIATIRRPEVITSHTVSAEVERQRNRVMVADAMAKARDAAERGSLKEAASMLERCRKMLGEASGTKQGDRLLIALDLELKEMQARMENMHRYEASGRAYVLSGLSSHSWQRATSRGDSATDSESILLAYQTPAMVDMVQHSQTFSRPDRKTAK